MICGITTYSTVSITVHGMVCVNMGSVSVMLGTMEWTAVTPVVLGHSVCMMNSATNRYVYVCIVGMCICVYVYIYVH